MLQRKQKARYRKYTFVTKLTLVNNATLSNQFAFHGTLIALWENKVGYLH